MFTQQRVFRGITIILIATVFGLSVFGPRPVVAGGLIAYEFGTADVGLASAGYNARAQEVLRTLVELIK